MPTFYKFLIGLVMVSAFTGLTVEAQPVPEDDDKNYLSKIPLNLRKGELLTEEALYSYSKSLPSSNKWTKVPTWLGGEWDASQGRLTVVDVARSTNENHKLPAEPKIACYAEQKDLNGELWQFIGGPDLASAENEKGTNIEITVNTYPAWTEDKSITFFSTKICLICDNATQKIVLVEQSDCIETIVRTGQNSANRYNSTMRQILSQDRLVPYRLDFIESTIKKSAAFTSINESEFVPYKKWFGEFRARQN